MTCNLHKSDPEIAAVLDSELARQRDQLEMIASENFTSQAVMEAMGSAINRRAFYDNNGVTEIPWPEKN